MLPGMPSQPACIWTVTPDLIRAIDTTLGPPVDSYVNGSQTWFTDEAALGDITLEWRLHPVAGFEPVLGQGVEERWEAVVQALESGADPAALPLGTEVRSLTSLWDGLECFAAYGDECEPMPLAHAAHTRLGIAPLATGLVDHEVIGDAWERAQGRVSIMELLRDALTVA